MRIAVIGTGYVGITTAVAFAHLGHRVIGVDIDRHRVDELNAGKCPIVEEGMPLLLAEGRRASLLSFTTEIDGAAGVDVVFLCLPTPAGSSGRPDLSAIEAACGSLRSVVSAGTILVCKSTVPVGTNARIGEWLRRPDVPIVSNPEFLREGSAITDFLEPDRVVIGSENPSAAAVLRNLYGELTDNIHMVTAIDAELIKYASNAFLATKLSYVNEIARICAAIEADPGAVLKGVGSDERIAAAFLQPGPGWGGSCFPKDTLALRSLALDTGTSTPVIDAAISSNQIQIDYTADRIDRLVGRVPSTIAVWGLSFKAGTDDTRDSPAVAVVEHLVSGGHRVFAFDPEARTTPSGAFRAPSMESAVTGADLLVVLTEWGEFAKADLAEVQQLMARPLVVDTRGVLDPVAVTEAGLSLLLGSSPPELCQL